MPLRAWKPIVSVKNRVKFAFTFPLALSFAFAVLGQFAAHDPGVRAGTVDAGSDAICRPAASP